MEVNGQLHAPAALPGGTSPHYPLHRGWGGRQNLSERYAEEKNLLHLLGTELRTRGP
jgi:hypothetical protein